MASRINLYNDELISDHGRGHKVKSMARSKTSLTPVTISGKTVGLSKPKGLSIRSKSDLNIPDTPSLPSAKQENAICKNKNFLTPKRTQLDAKGRPISPGKEIKKREAMESKKPKLHKSSIDCSFKKPLPPTKRVKTYAFPEQEKLAPYYDFESEFNNVDTLKIENELRQLFNHKLKLIKPFEDEGFESDQEACPSPTIPSLGFSFSTSDIELNDDIPELPTISDDELFI